MAGAVLVNANGRILRTGFPASVESARVRLNSDTATFSEALVSRFGAAANSIWIAVTRDSGIRAVIVTFRSPGFSDGTCTQPPRCWRLAPFVPALALCTSEAVQVIAIRARSSHSAVRASTAAVRFAKC